MKTLDLSWGDPFVVRQALSQTLGRSYPHSAIPLTDLGYTTFLGNPKLIDQLKILAKRQSGSKPKHLFITNGATGALHAALHALRSSFKTDYLVTDKRYYPIYPEIINAAGMVMINHDKKESLAKRFGASFLGSNNLLYLSASPSAPEGLVSPWAKLDIWDAAYASKTYSKSGHIPESHRIMCGSLSKTLGLAGLRLGWVSTNDDGLAAGLDQYISRTYVGLSGPSQAIAEEVLSALDFDSFEKRAAGYLDSNREEMQKVLNKLWPGASVPSRGMFAILELGELEKKVLERAHIKWQPGSSWGEDDSWARLSLGQSREITRSAVKAILK